MASLIDRFQDALRRITNHQIGAQVIAGLIVLAVGGVVGLWVHGSLGGDQLTTDATATSPTVFSTSTQEHPPTTASTTTSTSRRRPPGLRVAHVVVDEGMTAGAYGLLVSVATVSVNDNAAFYVDFSLDNGVGVPRTYRNATAGFVATFKRYRVRLDGFEDVNVPRFTITRRPK